MMSSGGSGAGIVPRISSGITGICRRRLQPQPWPGGIGAKRPAYFDWALVLNLPYSTSQGPITRVVHEQQQRPSDAAPSSQLIALAKRRAPGCQMARAHFVEGPGPPVIRVATLAPKGALSGEPQGGCLPPLLATAGSALIRVNAGLNSRPELLCRLGWAEELQQAGGQTGRGSNAALLVRGVAICNSEMSLFVRLFSCPPKPMRYPCQCMSQSR